jgi:hypothetical protein
MPTAGKDVDVPGMIGDVAGIADSISDIATCLRESNIATEELMVKAQVALDATKSLLHSMIERL